MDLEEKYFDRDNDENEDEQMNQWNIVDKLLQNFLLTLNFSLTF